MPASGYAHRDAEAWAIPLRHAGAQLIQDLHPHDRGPRGTHDGATIFNGNLYCPATPGPLLQLGPLARDATPADIAAHDRQAAELARHKLGRFTGDDADGYHRVMCPAAITIAFTPDSKTAYVGGGGTVTPISTATNTPGKPIHVGIPVAEVVAITPDGKLST